MSEFKLKQFRYESDTWKRSLDFMTEENIRLKTRLSEILKDPFDKNLLGDVERFQNSFIDHDQLIIFLRNNIAEIDQLLLKENIKDQVVLQKIDIKIRNVRGNVEKTERQFGYLKLDFNHYLTENMKYG